jgi:small subunit ribosomal protein S17
MIGIEVKETTKKCDDPNCPFHGKLSVRGQLIRGKVVSNKMEKSVVVERERKRYIPKYERYEKRTSRYVAHSPSCIPLKKGDEVRIMECRPLSKTISFVVVEKIKEEKNKK